MVRARITPVSYAPDWVRLEYVSDGGEHVGIVRLVQKEQLELLAICVVLQVQAKLYLMVLVVMTIRQSRGHRLRD